MREDLIKARPVGWRVLEEVADQILALSRNELMARAGCREVQDGTDDLLVLLEGNVTTDHVIEQNAHGPDGGGHAHVSPVVDPFRWRIDSRS